MTSFIEKLEGLSVYTRPEDEDYEEFKCVSYEELRAIIESAKSESQETKDFICHGCGTITDDPAGYKALLQKAGHLACCPDDKYVPFTNPPLSDETVKDGYVMVPIVESDRMLTIGAEIVKLRYVNPEITAHEVYKHMVKAAIKEAMKAAK